MFGMVWVMTILCIKWNHILASLQSCLAVNVWSGMTMSAIFHPIWRLLFPGCYARYVETKRLQREEAARKGEEAKRKRLEAAMDMEAGMNEQTPLTGRGFSRMSDGAYVEIPGYSEYTAESVRETGS
jgi:hypothetical protein